MLEIARKHNARFLLTSTSECYGDPLELVRRPKRLLGER